MATTTSTSSSHAHADHGHADHGPELQHHFSTAAQQKEAATLGMWVFLVTEVMLFGGIFMAYAVYRWAFPDIWAEAAYHLNTPLGTINTVVLLVSSLTVALAVSAAEAGKRTRIIQLIVVTMLLGLAFLGLKAYEYSEKFAHCAGYSTPIEWVTNTNQHAVYECLVPGQAFLFPADKTTGASNAPTVAGQPTPYQLFFLLYFIATGLHAVHMLIGLAIMSYLVFITWRGTISSTYFTPVEIGGLYWHLIDIVWVFLFPLFYLVH
ncbi:cytochrome c oxidase subunit 3 family protein [Candidatus Viridilinea mediisalina]|uniref:Cytochrome C oxidase subunit III n=1 Tax=Candidatus Viridilinea mediisalina TaxID=2024553 RepID=A0A2A6RK17_9CHLR|nr:cytochrome c oxidase subunit 3 family protein [Candidatus Viridilinea mediisalina]PDW03220.1 cytochrome C oxidase subunit III [Candidatus Viridilinea mediisalina]